MGGGRRDVVGEESTCAQGFDDFPHAVQRMCLGSGPHADLLIRHQVMVRVELASHHRLQTVLQLVVIWETSVFQIRRQLIRRQLIRRQLK
jgi:hypothetical protein